MHNEFKRKVDEMVKTEKQFEKEGKLDTELAKPMKEIVAAGEKMQKALAQVAAGVRPEDVLDSIEESAVGLCFFFYMLVYFFKVTIYMF